MRRRLPFRMLSIFFIFAIILVLPLAATVIKDLVMMVDAMDSANPLTTVQKIEYLKYKEKMLDDIVVMSFYIFVLAFIISVLFSRKLLSPINDLRDAMVDLADGRNGVRLDYGEGDEIGDAVRAFNGISRNLEGLRHDYARHNKMLELSPVPMVVLDEDHLVRESTPAFSRSYGYSPSELEGYGFIEIMEDEYAKRVRRRLLEGRLDEQIAFNVRMITKFDGLVPVRLELMEISGDGEHAGKVAYIKDLRNEETLEAALEIERRNAEAIIDSTEDLVVIVDRDFLITAANLAMRVRSGRDVRGESCHLAIYGNAERCYIKGDLCSAREVLDSGKPFRTVRDTMEMDGTKVFYDIMAFPLMDSAGDVRQVVISMRDITERVRFEEEIDRKNHELTGLNEISRILSRSLRAESIYDEIISKLCEMFGMDGGGIYIQDEMGRTLVCDSYKGLSHEFMEGIKTLKLGQDMPGMVASTATALFSQDIAVDMRAGDSAFRHTGIRSFACVPVRGKEKLIGVFFIFGFGTRIFTDSDEEMLGAVSEMMGISFDNSRLYGRMKSLYEQDRQRRSDEQKDLLNLSSMLASSPEIEDVLAPGLELVKRSCWADLALLTLRVEDGGLVVRASTDQALSKGENLYAPDVKSLESVSLERREPVIISGLSSVKNIHIDERLGKYFTSVSVPLYVGDRALGTLSLYYSGEITPSDEEVHFLRTIGSVFGVALERTRLFESVAIQRSMAETVLESIHDGVVTLSPGGAVISMNKAAGDILGVKHDKAVGFLMDDIVSSDGENFEFRERFLEGFKKASEGKPAFQQSTMRRPDGTLLPVAFSCAPAHARADDLVGAVCVFRDLSGTLELDKMKTDFVRSVSHEFRTPLTAIVGMTEMVLEGEVESEERVREYLETVLLESERLSTMVSDVLDIARIESGSMEFNEGDVDFVKIAKETKERLESAVSDHRASLDISVARGLKMKGDEEKLKLMLGHLIENSLKYSDKGVRVSLVVEDEGDLIIIKVNDDGWGISEKDLPRVGEKFFRAVTPVAMKGAGLGLAICREIASMHKGDIKIESTAGKGTGVTVSLPRGGSE
jgi:PAS domain S-box-containing protein